MAWIPSHQELRDHPKLLRLTRALGISRVQAIGHLQCLWWWALDHAPDGDLGDFDETDIAIAAEWAGDADALVDALTRCGPGDRHGFVAVDARGRMRLHDWADYGGKYTAELAAKREGGRRGNHERWHVRKKVVDDGCEFCTQEPPQDRSQNRKGSQSESVPDRTPNPRGEKRREELLPRAGAREAPPAEPPAQQQQPATPTPHPTAVDAVIAKVRPAMPQSDLGKLRHAVAAALDRGCHPEPLTAALLEAAQRARSPGLLVTVAKEADPSDFPPPPDPAIAERAAAVDDAWQAGREHACDQPWPEHGPAITAVLDAIWVDAVATQDLRQAFATGWRLEPLDVARRQAAEWAPGTGPEWVQTYGHSQPPRLRLVAGEGA